MADSVAMRIWLGRALFLASALMLIFFDLVPLGFEPRFVPLPDLLLCLVLAISLRRAEFAPVWLIAPVFLASDLIFMRPPGLWTGIVLISCAFLRQQEYRLREHFFLYEWLTVATTLIVAVLSERAILSLALVPVAEFGRVTLYVLTSVAAYPAVVLFCRYALGIRKVTPREAVMFGRHA